MMEPGELWYACEFPERETDAMTLWHSSRVCSWCCVKALMILKQNPNDPEITYKINFYLSMGEDE